MCFMLTAGTRPGRLSFALMAFGVLVTTVGWAPGEIVEFIQNASFCE